MNDSPISKKSYPVISLAVRVLLVAFLLLVIPLFFQSLFLYLQEYSQKLFDVKEDLQILVKERAALVEERIEIEWEVLTAASSVAAERPAELEIEEVRPPSGTPAAFVTISRQKEALVVGKKKSDSVALVRLLPFSELIESVMVLKDYPYPIRMAFLDGQNQVLAESQKQESTQELLSDEQPLRYGNIRLALTIPQEAILELHQRDYYFRFATLVFFVGFLGGGAVLWLTWRIARPLRGLCKTMGRVSEGAVHERYTPDWMGFEINVLGKQFNGTLDRLLMHQQEAVKERLARERLAEELKIGHEIQKNLLPTQWPDFSEIDLTSAYLPAKEVGGDFYDLFSLPDGKLLMAMADTAGKGISACLFSLGLRSMIRTLATTTSDLSEIVLRANDLFWIDARNSGMFVTLWMGIFDPKTRLLTYCSQGHPPALLRRKGQVLDLSTEGIAMGAQQLEAISCAEIVLLPGDLLLLYTDGIIEAHNAKDQLFGVKRLKELLLHDKKRSAQQLADHLLKEVSAFSQDVAQHDDIALLIFHIDS
jgi:serine phosphatase RsbU (regulator of sigma subunit)